MQKQSDDKVKIKCPCCNKFHYYDLENDEDHCEFIRDGVYIIWCKDCGEENCYQK